MVTVTQGTATSPQLASQLPQKTPVEKSTPKTIVAQQRVYSQLRERIAQQKSVPQQISQTTADITGVSSRRTQEVFYRPEAPEYSPQYGQIRQQYAERGDIGVSESQIAEELIKVPTAFGTGVGFSTITRSLAFAPKLATLFRASTLVGGSALVGQSAAEISKIPSPRLQSFYFTSLGTQIGAAVGGGIIGGTSGWASKFSKIPEPSTMLPGTKKGFERPSTSPKFTELPQKTTTTKITSAEGVPVKISEVPTKPSTQRFDFFAHRDAVRTAQVSRPNPFMQEYVLKTYKGFDPMIGESGRVVQPPVKLQTPFSKFLSSETSALFGERVPSIKTPQSLRTFISSETSATTQSLYRPMKPYSPLRTFISDTSSQVGLRSLSQAKFTRLSRFIGSEEATASLLPQTRQIPMSPKTSTTPITYRGELTSTTRLPSFGFLPIVSTTQFQTQLQSTDTIPKTIQRPAQITERQPDTIQQQYQPQIQIPAQRTEPRQVQLTGQSYRQDQVFGFTTYAPPKTIPKPSTPIPPPLLRKPPEEKPKRYKPKQKKLIIKKRQRIFSIKPFAFKPRKVV